VIYEPARRADHATGDTIASKTPAIPPLKSAILFLKTNDKEVYHDPKIRVAWFLPEAGKAVANILGADPRFDLLDRAALGERRTTRIPSSIIGTEQQPFDELFTCIRWMRW
jgi:hypothetical protein